MLPKFTTLSPSANPQHTHTNTHTHIHHHFDPELQRKVNTIARLNLRPTQLDICPCESCIYQHQRPVRASVGLEMSKYTTNKKAYHSLSKYGISLAQQSSNSNSINNSNTIDAGNDSTVSTTHRILPSKSLSMNQEHIHANPRALHPVVTSSNYKTNYLPSSITPPQKPRPRDELSFDGPVTRTSAYLQSYPEFRNNRSPYVRKKEEYMGGMGMMGMMQGESSYRKEFAGKSAVVERNRPSDCLRSIPVWTGDSTYRTEFNKQEQGRSKGNSNCGGSGGNSSGIGNSNGNSNGRSHKSSFTAESTSLVPPSVRGTDSTLQTVERQQRVPVADRYSNLSDSISDPHNYKHQYQTVYRKDYLRGRKQCERNRGEGVGNNPILAALGLF